MPREHVIIECSEARKEGKPVSRYMTTRNKKLQPEKIIPLSGNFVNLPRKGIGIKS